LVPAKRVETKPKEKPVRFQILIVTSCPFTAAIIRHWNSAFFGSYRGSGSLSAAAMY
jgi:hypothetical protein